MITDWHDEMKLLSDDELHNIADAPKDSWGYKYCGGGRVKGCVYGHALKLNKSNVLSRMKAINKELQIYTWTPLEKYYKKAWTYNRNSKHNVLRRPTIIEEIQAYARQLLKERAERIEYMPEIEEIIR